MRARSTPKGYHISQNIEDLPHEEIGRRMHHTA
jgi:hypothetical protein